MAGHGELQAAAERRAVERGNHGFGKAFDQRDQIRKIRRGDRLPVNRTRSRPLLRKTSLPAPVMTTAPIESAFAARSNPSAMALRTAQTERIHRRAVQGDDGDGAV